MNAPTQLAGRKSVHPHGRGDNRALVGCPPARVGSPPRAWGQCGRVLRGEVARRFTPTGVGTIDDAPFAVRPYPGSPPRAWGQCRRAGRHEPQRRFTPTGVGTITPRPHARRCATVHPHGRGDNSRWSRSTRSSRGSPPRAWGQSIVGAGEERNLRFTPTGVGTMSPRRIRRSPTSVHPHGRGDNHVGERFGVQFHGSPPRAWGQYDLAGAGAAVPRFTPTGVGTM